MVGPTTEPDLTSMGLMVTRSGEVKLAPLTDGTWIAEVVVDGETKAGVGDDPVDALLSLIVYILPPDHPDYPS